MTEQQARAIVANGPRVRAKACLSRKIHAEHLATLTVFALVEVSISLELAYWVLGILFGLTLFSREAALIIFYAEEAGE